MSEPVPPSPHRRILPPAPWRWPAAARATLFGLAIGVVLWASLAPTEDVPGAGLVWDKAEHVAAFLGLGGMGVAFYPSIRMRIIGLLFVLGALIEVAQASMGFGRQGDWRDLLADSLGLAAAWALSRLVIARA